MNNQAKPSDTDEKRKNLLQNRARKEIHHNKSRNCVVKTAIERHPGTELH